MTSGPVTLVIEGLGAQGDGVASHLGDQVYVPGCAPGDRVEVTLGATGKFGPEIKTMRLIGKGDGHQEPPCQHYDRCGGCSLQHLSPRSYHRWLEGRLLDPLARLGIKPHDLLDPILCDPRTRRRITVKLRREGDKVVLGFNEAKSHRLAPIEDCFIAHPDLTALFKPLQDTLGGVMQNRQQMDITLTRASNGIDMVIKGQGAPSLDQRLDLTAMAQDHDVAALHWSDRGALDPIIIRTEPIMRFGEYAVSLPPGGFIQATDAGEKALQTAAIWGDVAGRRVADLFSGLGTFSLPLIAKGARVTAVEGAAAPLKALKNAGQRHQLALQAHHRDLFRRPLSGQELASFDRVVLDPPRAGAKEQMALLAKSTVPEILSISCNPATFARDAKILTDGGYALKKLQAVDQFLWSPHLELAGLFTRS